MRFKDADISDAYVSGWGLRAQKDCTTIDKVHSEQDQKNLFGKFIMMHYCQEAALVLSLKSYPVPKLYIPSTQSTDYLLWHTKLIVCAVKYLIVV